MQPPSRWQPTRFVRFERALDTSMGTAQIVTDVGKAYCKALGNRQGPHALACEWVGSQLAKWLGLPTFDFAIMELDDQDEIPLPRDGHAQPGPAFVTRAERGHTWGGSAEELTLVDNQADIARLVVFDTWTLNCDRHPPDLTVRKPNYDNVFLSDEGATAGRFRLVAMDHTHCFTCGSDLNERISSIDRTKDDRIYGLFPGFMTTMTASRLIVESTLGRLRAFDAGTCNKIVASIPGRWDVADAARTALIDLICQRASFVADTFMQRLAPICWPQGELEFEERGGDS